VVTVQYQNARAGLLRIFPGYSLSKLVVSSLLPTHYPESRNAFFWLEAMLQIFRAFKQLYPETYSEQLGLLDLGKKTLPEIMAETSEAERRNEEHPLGSLTLGLLQKVFPIDEDIVYQDMLEGEGEGFPSIWIYPQYTAFTGDDIEEMLQSPQDQSQELSAILFFILFDHQLGEEAWADLKTHFGWPVDYIDILGRDDYVDDKVLARLLKEEGLYPFFDLWLSVAYATGNPFIDFDEYGNDRQWELTYKNILFLKKEWDEAQEILDNCKEAERMVEEDPNVLLKVAEIIRKSIQYRKEKKG
jgi:hypothetical protein